MSQGVPSCSGGWSKYRLNDHHIAETTIAIYELLNPHSKHDQHDFLSTWNINRWNRTNNSQGGKSVGGVLWCPVKSGLKRYWIQSSCYIYIPDIDECLQSTCAYGSLCYNLPGSFRCECPRGYTGDALQSCERDVVEVACQGDHKCTEHAHCVDGICQCRNGYQVLRPSNNREYCNNWRNGKRYDDQSAILFIIIKTTEECRDREP